MKYYWYDDKYIKKYIQTKFSIPNIDESYCGSVEYKKLYQINRIFSNSPWGMLHDSTNHVAHPFNIQTKVKYKYRSCEKTFEQVCIDVAKKIVSGTDKPFAILWSGGIDSTAALVSMLQTADHSKITVVCNHKSIKEAPHFYQDVIQGQIKTIPIHEWCCQAEDFFTISGDAGDTVWGVLDDSFWESHSESIHQPWKQYVSPNNVDIDFVDEFCSWSGTDINTLVDLRTWFYLCCKWQDKSMRAYEKRPGLSNINATGFYDYGDSFQVWTMNNLDKIIGNKWNEYKLPAKKFIHQFYKDDDYLQNKTKEVSVSIETPCNLWALQNKKSQVVIDSNFKSYDIENWPFVDFVEFENWNDQHHLIPSELLQ